jgi:hypothetical protein
MPLGYKYAERSADSQINWAEVGRESSGMLLEVNRVREEKKEAYKQAARDEMNNLMNSPQGQDRDANGFINNYAHDMINQKKIDKDLFERGMLNERDYTLRMQNQMDGTKNLFEIQKLYQEKYKEKMDGVTSGKLQAMNIFNMGMVEGYGDFNNSKATINPEDGTVGIGLMENQIIDGKTVRVLSKNIAPVNVIRGKILHDIPTFDVDAQTTKTVSNFGSRKDTLYNAATTLGAGTLTELMGIDFLKTVKDPTDRKIVEDMNTAIDDQVGSYFSNPYNLSSVLTENLGKYNSKSFTFDKDEANSDPSKILVKIDPNTKMTTLDDTGKNYKEQKKEASDWVKRDILRKMDQERTIKTTAQNQLQESAETIARVKKKYEPKTPQEDAQKAVEQDAENFALNTTYILTGNDEQKAKGLAYMRSRGADIRSNPPGKPPGNYIMTKNGLVAFESKGDTMSALRGITGALLKATGATLPEDMVVKKGSGKLGRNFNTAYSGTGGTIDTEGEVAKKITKVTDVNLFKSQNSNTTAAVIKEQIGNIPNIKIVAEGGGLITGNKITITKPGAQPLVINSNESGATADNQAKALKEWLQNNLSIEEKMILSGESQGGDKAP